MTTPLNQSQFAQRRWVSPTYVLNVNGGLSAAISTWGASFPVPSGQRLTLALFNLPPTPAGVAGEVTRVRVRRFECRVCETTLLGSQTFGPLGTFTGAITLPSFVANLNPGLATVTFTVPSFGLGPLLIPFTQIASAAITPGPAAVQTRSFLVQDVLTDALLTKATPGVDVSVLANTDTAPYTLGGLLGTLALPGSNITPNGSLYPTIGSTVTFVPSAPASYTLPPMAFGPAPGPRVVTSIVYPARWSRSTNRFAIRDPINNAGEENFDYLACVPDAWTMPGGLVTTDTGRVWDLNGDCNVELSFGDALLLSVCVAPGSAISVTTFCRVLVESIA